MSSFCRIYLINSTTKVVSRENHFLRQHSVYIYVCVGDSPYTRVRDFTRPSLVSFLQAKKAERGLGREVITDKIIAEGLFHSWFKKPLHSLVYFLTWSQACTTTVLCAIGLSVLMQPAVMHTLWRVIYLCAIAG